MMGQEQSYGAYPRRQRRYDDTSAYPPSVSQRGRTADAGPVSPGKEESIVEQLEYPTYQSSPFVSESTAAGESEYESIPPIAPSYDNARRRPRVHDDSRPIYDLYHGDIEDKLGTDGRGQIRHEQVGRKHLHQKQWKDRLRNKFDVALGLQPPADDTATYYDSWKTQMKDVDDDRKEALRQQMNAAGSEQMQAPLQTSQSPTSYPKNRRARMRAKSNFDIPPPPDKSYKSRLDEVPFWREQGNIASLLFDNRPSSLPPPSGARDGSGRPPMRRGPLEVCLIKTATTFSRGSVHT